MRIAVAGATGRIGAITVAALERDGHEAVRISRSLGVDLLTGAGLAEVLAELALGAPKGRYVDIAGPDPQDLVDMARRTHAARGRVVRLVPTWDGVFGVSMSGNVLLPGANARITPTSFDDWLETLR